MSPTFIVQYEFLANWIILICLVSALNMHTACLQRAAIPRSSVFCSLQVLIRLLSQQSSAFSSTWRQKISGCALVRRSGMACYAGKSSVVGAWILITTSGIWSWMGTAACVAWLVHAMLIRHPSVVGPSTFCLFRQEKIHGHLSRVLSPSLHYLLPSGSLFHLGITYAVIHSFVCLFDLRFSAITLLFRSL